MLAGLRCRLGERVVAAKVSKKLAELGGSPEQTLELTPELEAAAAEVPEYEAES